MEGQPQKIEMIDLMGGVGLVKFSLMAGSSSFDPEDLVFVGRRAAKNERQRAPQI